MDSQLYLILVAIVIGLHILARRERINILKEELRLGIQEARAAQYDHLPITVPLRMEAAIDRRKIGRRGLFLLFCPVGSLLGYLAGFYFRNEWLSLMGAIAGIYVAVIFVRRIEDARPIDERIYALTREKEVVIEHGRIRVTRALAFTGPVLPTDEEHYLTIPLAGKTSIFLHHTPISTNGMMLKDCFGIRIKHAGRQVWIPSRYIYGGSKHLVAALKRQNFTVLPSHAF